MGKCFLLALLLLAGCGPLKTTVSLGSRAHFPLITQSGSSPIAAVQHFRIENRGRVLQFNGFAEIEPERWAIVGLTPMESRGFSVTWDSGELLFEHLPFYKLPIKPGHFMADYQMMFMAEDLLRTHLEAAGLELRVEGLLRRIYKGKTEVVRINYQEQDPMKGKVLLRNLRRNHVVIISTRQIEPLDDEM